MSMIASIMYGAKTIDFQTAWQAIVHYDFGNVDHVIIATGRIPRAIAAAVVGASLAAAGAIMQGVTRNYLASPSIMGVNDGSVFMITLAIVFMPHLTNSELIILSMIGSAFGAGLVYGFGSLFKDGLSPVRLAIIGTVIGTFLSSTATAVAMYFQVSQNITAWYSTKIQTVDPPMLYLSLPILGGGLLLAIAVSKAVTIASLGEETAIGLGQKTKWIKVISMLSVVCLTGVSVALVGKIGFVGLVVPHISRFLTGSDYRVIVPCAAFLGAAFLTLCDCLSRMVNFPFETPVGVVTSLIGVPFFLYLIRTKGGNRNAL